MTFKKILNGWEERTHSRLREACEKHEAHVFAKVRIADVLAIEASRIGPDLYRFALQAHFDFVVTDSNQRALFAVEFDGPNHNNEKQRERDGKKNKICQRFGFPILRINSRYLENKYRGFDLLSWFIEVWFLREAFFEAQQEGHIPEDEDFDPWLFVSLPGSKKWFPLWLSRDILSEIRRLAEQKKIRYPMPTGEWIGKDKFGNYHGIIWLWIDNQYGVYAQTAMRAQDFPVPESDILGEILVFELFDELLDVLIEKVPASPISSIIGKVEALEAKYQLMMSSSASVPPNADESAA